MHDPIVKLREKKRTLVEMIYAAPKYLKHHDEVERLGAPRIPTMDSPRGDEQETRHCRTNALATIQTPFTRTKYQHQLQFAH